MNFNLASDNLLVELIVSFKDYKPPPEKHLKHAQDLWDGIVGMKDIHATKKTLETRAVHAAMRDRGVAKAVQR